jgi:periplasmic divalent cation tolerance protein
MTARMDGTVMIYTTWPSAVEAEAAGRAIVADGLAACVNILPGMMSIYRWQGEIEQAQETVMIFKTREDLSVAVTQAVRARHPYEVPAVVVMAIVDGDPDYLDWITTETVG